MSLLDGDLAALIGEAFSSGELAFFDAVRHREYLVQDVGGNTTIGHTETPCLGLVLKCTESMRRAEGYTEDDMQVMILGTSLNPVQATTEDLTTDDQVTVLGGPYAGVRWALASVEIDPAGATITCRGQRTTSAESDSPVVRLLSGGVTGSATLYAALQISVGLSGSVVGVGLALGALTLRANLSGQIAGTGALSGAFATDTGTVAISPNVTFNQSTGEYKFRADRAGDTSGTKTWAWTIGPTTIPGLRPTSPADFPGGVYPSGTLMWPAGDTSPRYVTVTPTSTAQPE